MPLGAASVVNEVEATEAEEVTEPLAATDVNEYAVPAVRPVIEQVVAGEITVHEPPPFDAVTTYEVAPATTPGVTTAVPDTVEVAVGAEGAARVVNEVEATEAEDEPAMLLATALNVYAVPFVRPVMLHEIAGAVTVQVAPPGDAVST